MTRRNNQLLIGIVLISLVIGCDSQDRRSVTLPKGMRRANSNATMAKPTGIAGGAGEVSTIAAFGRWSPNPNLMFLSEPVARYSEVLWELDSVTDKQRLRYMIIDAGYMLGDVETDIGFRRLAPDAKLISEIYWEQAHAFAQTSHPDDAIAAIRNSIRFGMSDANRIQHSKGLDSLRDMEAFKELIGTCNNSHHSQTVVAVHSAFPNQPMFIKSDYQDFKDNSVDISTQIENLAVIYYWGSWSRPCREMLPCIETTRQTFENRGVKCFGIALEPGSRDAQAHIKIAMKDAQANFPVYLDRFNEQGRNALSQELLPVTLIVNQQMMVLAKIPGYQSQDVLTGVLNHLHADASRAPSF